MNKSTLAYIFVMLIFLLSDFSQREAEAIPIDIFRAEGYVAFILNEKIKNLIPQPEPTTQCDCNGTKQIKTGDNRLLPCPCDNCTCKKKAGDAPTTVAMEKQILYFGAEWCVPCQVFKKTEFPKLKELGYNISEGDTNFRVIDVEKNPELYNKYGRGRGLPLIILIENGVETKFVNNSQYPAKTESVKTLWMPN